MSIEAQKLEIIEWVSRLNNVYVIQEVLSIKQKEKIDLEKPKRKFGDGMHIVTYIAPDFNEPLEDFKDYM